MIPYGRQDISEADIQAVVNVLRSDFLTQGPAVPSFEKGIADYCGVEQVRDLIRTHIDPAFVLI